MKFMNMKTIVMVLVLLMVMPLVLADTETYKVNQLTDLKFTCTLNDAIPSAAAWFIK